MVAISPMSGNPALPLNLLAQAIPMLTRHDLERLTERLIETLDAWDGDPDLEEDDPAGQSDEDGLNCGTGVITMHGTSYGGPGCHLSDGY